MDEAQTERAAREVANALIHLKSLSNGTPLAMRVEAMWLEAERTADRLQGDYDDPATGSYRNKDTAARIESLRLMAPALRCLWGALREDDDEVYNAVRQAGETSTTFAGVWEAVEPDSSDEALIAGGVVKSRQGVELFVTETDDTEKLDETVLTVIGLMNDFEKEKGDVVPVYLNGERLGLTVPTPDFFAEVKALLGEHGVRRA